MEMAFTIEMGTCPGCGRLAVLTSGFRSTCARCGAETTASPRTERTTDDLRKTADAMRETPIADILALLDAAIGGRNAFMVVQGIPAWDRADESKWTLDEPKTETWRDRPPML